MPDDEKTQDETMDAMTEAVEAVGFRIATNEELDAVLAVMEENAAQADEQARAEGRRFLDEETDRDLIKSWFAEARKVETVEQAADLLRKLTTEYRHDYGTICHAIAAGALAGAYAAGATEITGFQAGAIFWEFSRHWMQWDEGPRRLVEYNDLLYPQYDRKFTTISPETAEHLRKTAELRIESSAEHAHPDVVRRWREVARGEFPGFISIEAA